MPGLRDGHRLTMTERIDHAAEARQHIDWAHEQQEHEGDMGNVPRDNALIAQSHATLALVEQQRIANRIALCSLVAETERAFTQHGVRAHLIGHEAAIYDYGHYPEDAPTLAADIREGLGL